MNDTPKATATEFVDVLMRQGNGATNQELSAELREIVQRVKSTGKAGTLTLALRVELIKSTNSIVVTDTIRAKKPEYDRPSSVFFADLKGNLLRDNPDQPTIFDLAEVPTPTPAAVVTIGGDHHVIVNPETGEIQEPEA